MLDSNISQDTIQVCAGSVFEKKDTCLYVHLRKDDKLVFYVGIGTKRRPYEKRPYNPHWTRVAEKHGYIVHIIYNNLTWKEACDLEINLIKYYRELNGIGLTNIADGGEGAKGVKRSPESIAKVAEFNKGKHLSEEHKQKIREGNLGKVASLETLAKMSASLKGIRHTEEAKRKISEGNKGKPKSKEHIEALRNKVVTDETRARMSASRKLRIMPPVSEETKAKIGAASRGRIMSEETRKRMSAAKKVTWSQKKASNQMLIADVGFCFRVL